MYLPYAPFWNKQEKHTQNMLLVTQCIYYVYIYKHYSLNIVGLCWFL